jgi:hypothetical protein
VVPDGFVLEGEHLPPVQAAPVADEPPPPEFIEDPEETPAGANQRPAPSPAASQPPGQVETGQRLVPLPAGPDAEQFPPRVPYILSPLPAGSREDIHMVTVILRPGVDKVRDNLRLRQAYGILISYPGSDRFALQIFERGRGYRIEFPNFTTGLCPELLARLYAIVSPENVIVEELTLQ